jgi:hypothetical protein
MIPTASWVRRVTDRTRSDGTPSATRETRPTGICIVLSDDIRSHGGDASQRIWHPAETLEGYLQLATMAEILFDITVNFEGRFPAVPPLQLNRKFLTTRAI